ncbi:MAG: hypothetical protein H6Q69_4984 [Firmicutes bacterium]|nr:hypothetical protein [Bacillota bacterium]
MKLPKHKCGLYLTHNNHKDYYLTATQAIEDEEKDECPVCWENEESKQEARDTNEIWTLQWYPETPIGSYHIAAPTLEKLLKFAEKVEVKP